MFKKRLLAFGLAGVMVMGLNMSVLAANTADQGTTPTEPKSVEATVTGTVPTTYTITIPTTISDADQELTVVASNFNIETGYTLKVAVEKDSIQLYLGGVTVGATDKQKYEIGFQSLIGDTKYTTSTPMLSLQKGATNLETKFKPSVASDAKKGKEAGSYAGSATFNITYAK